MKLNPPETAPKDRLILADLGHPYIRLFPTVWNKYNGTWEIFRVSRTQMFNGSVLDHAAEDSDWLLGWLPMPQIDENGNVQ